MKAKRNNKTRQRRKYRVRKKVFGTAERPRLSVFRSNKHMYAQIIDDMAGVTLVAANTQQKAIGESLKSCANKSAAEQVGEALAKEANKVGITNVCFDRNEYKYHGRVKSLADAARKAGLVF